MAAAVSILMILAVVFISGGETTTVTLDPAFESKNIEPGETFTLKCSFGQFPSGASGLFIKNGTKNGDPVIHISTFNVLEPTFKDTQRYSAVLGSGFMTLTIKDITYADSGRIGCQVINKNVVVAHKTMMLNVIGNPTEVKLVSTKANNRKELDATPGDEIHVSCVSKNSHPEANVRIMIGDVDITNQFMENTTETTTSVGEGLVDTSYTTELKAEKFMLKGEYAGKRLICKSTVSTLTPVQDYIDIKMQAVPKVMCPPEILASRRKMGFKIICKVETSTPFKSNGAFTWYYFKKNGHNVTFSDNQSHYFLSEYRTSGGGGKEAWNVTLKYDNYPGVQHFRNYTLVATNAMGSAMGSTYVKNSDPGAVSSCQIVCMDIPIISFSIFVYLLLLKFH